MISFSVRESGITVVVYCSPGLVGVWMERVLNPTGKGTKSVTHWPKIQAACMAPSKGKTDPIS